MVTSRWRGPSLGGRAGCGARGLGPAWAGAVDLRASWTDDVTICLMSPRREATACSVTSAEASRAVRSGGGVPPGADAPGPEEWLPAREAAASETKSLRARLMRAITSSLRFRARCFVGYCLTSSTTWSRASRAEVAVGVSGGSVDDELELGVCEKGGEVMRDLPFGWDAGEGEGFGDIKGSPGLPRVSH